VFWTVKFEFPQKLVCLLLNMLPDPDYKVNLLFFMKNAIANLFTF
jgi:E3 ubiquitin-protein ligase UBR3